MPQGLGSAGSVGWFWSKIPTAVPSRHFLVNSNMELLVPPNRKPDLTKYTSLWSRALRCGSIRRMGRECSVRGSVEAPRAEARYR